MPAIVIEIRHVDGRREQRRFNQTTITIGREAGDVVLGDPQSSARHGEIRLEAGGATFRDTQSTNGSYLSTGQRITDPQPLTPGMEIRIGKSGLLIQDVQLGAALGPSGTVVIDSASATAEPWGAQAASPGEGGASAPVGSAAASTGPYGALPGSGDSSVSAAGLPPPAGASADPSAASGPASIDPVAFVAECLRDYRPHWLEGAKVIGVFAVPIALIEALAGYVPVLGLVIGIVTALASALLMGVFGLGAQAEFAMRASASLPVTASQVWTVQLRRMVPWFLGILVPLLVSMVGCVVTLVLFGALLLPVYMVEEKRMLEVNLRSFELLKKDWVGVLGPAVLVALPVILAHGLILLVLGALPFVGELLAAVAGAAFVAAMSPFTTYVQFRVYYAVRRRHEGHDPAADVRAKVATPAGAFGP